MSLDAIATPQYAAAMEHNKLSLSIRMAEANDAPAIASVLLQSFAEYQALYTPAAFAATTPTADIIRRRLAEGPVWAACYEGAVVGTVSAVPRGGGCYVRSMAITPTARGIGLGCLLLEHVEKFAAEQSYTYLLLSTTPFLTRAIRLYERVGFQRSGEGPHALFGTALFTMVKLLGRVE